MQQRLTGFLVMRNRRGRDASHGDVYSNIPATVETPHHEEGLNSGCYRRRGPERRFWSASSPTPVTPHGDVVELGRRSPLGNFPIGHL